MDHDTDCVLTYNGNWYDLDESAPILHLDLKSK